MNYELGRFVQVFTVMLAGGVLGIGSALFAVDIVYKSETETTGPWRAQPERELATTNRWVRTATTLSGTWVAAPAGAREWTTLTDSDGERLDGGCTYYLIGKPQTSALWSVTLYDNDHQLPDVGNRKTHVFAGDVRPDGQGQVQLQAGGPDQGGAWLPAGTGPFSLTYRTYGESAGGDGNLPFLSIHRGDCE